MPLSFSFSASAAAASARPSTSLLHIQENLTGKCASNVMLWRFTKVNNLKVCKVGLQKAASKYSTLVTMSASATVVDHVVLFKVKPETPADKTQAMLDGLRGLSVLDGVLQLTVAPALNLWPAQTSWAAGFTHALHGRYKDKASLDAYTISSAHVSVVENNVKPIIDGLLAVDWEASPSPPVEEDFGVLRIALLKLKEGLTEEDVTGILGTFNSYPSTFPSVVQVSAGPNFSPVRAQGFNYGYLAQFKSVKELEELTANPDHVALMESKVNPHVESFILVDALK
ncbi:hypothetical protein O6H91_18G076000 [Diphasiastrum complanatum]|uniref:Uncharacterized protein n=1 Tax=Diphasiastrum complanatum TaxID=34168 RepID=A0ACC2B2S3_DIPCM|nr:hypothetical protein O6H91_18G076000 [Diphasiastrum complanatum]